MNSPFEVRILFILFKCYRNGKVSSSLTRDSVDGKTPGLEAVGPGPRPLKPSFLSYFSFYMQNDVDSR